MKKILVSLVLILVTAITYAQTTTFILVRHAEKESDGTRDPELSAEGKLRAERFAALVSKTNIDAIYSTDFKRTRNTVTPLALAKALRVNTYSSMKAADLEALLAKHTHSTIVLAGHSNTIPEIANALVGEKKFAQFSDDDYGNVLIITVSTVGKDAKVVWLTY
jgi:2,3-bisphosphoglycerate-dependent phosphoglycerate mutase